MGQGVSEVINLNEIRLKKLLDKEADLEKEFYELTNLLSELEKPDTNIVQMHFRKDQLESKVIKLRNELVEIRDCIHKLETR